MKRHLYGPLAALVLFGGAGLAFADEVIIIKPEQETVIREYVKKKPLASINLPGVELNVGSTVPDTVELHKIESPDVQYDYVVVDDRTVVVDPGTRKVIRVLE